MSPPSPVPSALAERVERHTGERCAAGYERADVCAVSAASVIAEAMVALVVADAALARIGGETMAEFRARYQAHRDRVREIGRGQ